ncbi:MAG: tRNA (adenosine(37)-N6)-threonylcarbamoyltransferase complex ATPase subunit type 1 TsaE [Acidobacteria bacterium]|nr:MAG: tRNA (adenosine(37)-N6)-threonylcarbamoyltransferase complex ATPase subunit type 1 TsaE [Acidobacteriota bacterium]
MKRDGTASSPSPPSSRLLLDTITQSPEETIQLAMDLARQLSPPCLILLEGELGSGKTTFTKGLVAGLGAAREDEVTSPTFALVHEYGGKGRVFHVDLYRVETPRELQTLGLEDLLTRSAFEIVEWGEKFARAPEVSRLRVRFEHAGPEARRIIAEFS